MVKQPAAIIIVRHGTRLDQVDRTWRAMAEHPYDPPLSYGGWIQCQTLGARIDRELLALEQQTTPADLEREDHGENKRPRKRRKIILHSSPYKRCVQTSIAIAAGLKYPTPQKVRPLPTPFQRPSHPLQRSSVVSNASASSDAPTLASTSNEDKSDKIELKIDPYLGEWLSTSYFEDSKPPPSTDVLVDRAKDTMTRPIQEIRGADLNAFLPVLESPEVEDRELESPVESPGGRAMGSVMQPVHNRTRHSSFGFNGVAPQRPVQRLRQRASTVNIYSPPLPQYSLAPQDPIPAGYVAHARDGCVNPNTTWDSKEMGWGNAGEYPEEWSAMHVRFRLGLQNMLAHYEHYQCSESRTGEDDIEDELVLVLVTHQAGANALIRLMTGAPALHDVGVASLTLASRRPVLRRQPSITGTSHSPLAYSRERRKSRRGSLDLGIADDFEMRIIASTDHLRNGSNPLGLNSPGLRQSPAMVGRKLAGMDSLDSFSIGDPLGWRPGSGGSIGRNTSQRGRKDNPSIKPAAGSGLWGSPAFAATVRQPIREDLDDLVPMSPKSRPTTPPIDRIPEEPLNLSNRSRSNTAQSGLWGGATSTDSKSRSASGGTWTPAGSEASQGSGVVSRNRSPARRRWTAVSTAE